MSPLPHPELHVSHCPKEFWLTYHQISRCNRPSTAQLIELECKNQKLTDLESLLDHVFQQGFVDNKYRTSTWWECRDGSRVKSSLAIEELFKQGVGKCQDSALRLVIADMPPALWFTYNYVNSPTGHVVAQRIKFDAAQVNGAPFEKLAHVTNHIFRQGYLPAKFRSLVHWEGSCGKRLSEGSSFPEVFAEGFGATEERPLRLVIDNGLACKCACGCRSSETHSQNAQWSHIRYT